MKIKLFVPSLVLAIGSFMISCETDSNSEGDNASSEISSNNLSGFINSEEFTPATTQFAAEELFGDNGYSIKLFKDVKDCDGIVSRIDVSFFIESETELTKGTYDAKGPYFNYGTSDDSGSVSFFGADVVIEEVSETTIVGRVKGGDDKNEHFIEGAFTASLCQN